MKVWSIYTKEYYSAVEKNEVMKLAVKRMELGKIILSEVAQDCPKQTTHVFSQMCMLASNLLCVFSLRTCGSQETRNEPLGEALRENDSRI